MTLKEIFELMDKFAKSSLGEIEVKIGDTSVSLKNPVVTNIVAAPVHHTAPAAPAASASAHHQAVADYVPAHKEGVEILSSPIVGTFYRSAAPDVPPFADVGTKLDVGATVCILEAMKVMNRLEAEFKLEIVSILVENGQMVEFGTPLFEVKRI